MKKTSLAASRKKRQGAGEGDAVADMKLRQIAYRIMMLDITMKQI